jgi:hypothetical protein
MNRLLSTLRRTRESHLALLLEMRSRLSRMRATRFQSMVIAHEARQIREKITSEEEGK